MKLFYLLVILISPLSVSAFEVETLCNNEYLTPYITIVNTIINFIKIGVPIILIILGMIDMTKAVASQKDEKIKAGQKTLISRLITGAIIFFIVAIIQLIVGIIENTTGESGIWDCVCKFVGSCK